MSLCGLMKKCLVSIPGLSSIRLNYSHMLNPLDKNSALLIQGKKLPSRRKFQNCFMMASFILYPL
jgi:hypothetical protein